MNRCSQAGCAEYAAYRFTWPGKDESFICEADAPKLRSVAAAIGLHLQLVPLLVPVVGPQPRHCEAEYGCGPLVEDGFWPLVACSRTATKLAIDDDGNTAYLCARCAAAFEGGMEIRDLPPVTKETP